MAEQREIVSMRVEAIVTRVTYRNSVQVRSEEVIHSKEEHDFVTAYHCVGCDHIGEECEEEKLYECGECGTKFPQSDGGGRNGNMCPQCLNKFGSKIADRFCSECRESEVEEEEVVRCQHCEALVLEGDFIQHLIDDHASEVLA